MSDPLKIPNGADITIGAVPLPPEPEAATEAAILMLRKVLYVNDTLRSLAGKPVTEGDSVQVPCALSEIRAAVTEIDRLRAAALAGTPPEELGAATLLREVEEALRAPQAISRYDALLLRCYEALRASVGGPPEAGPQ